MSRFLLDRDIAFFKTISRELVDDVIKTTVILYKLVLDNITTNLYGESLDKSYYKGLESTALIERDDTSSRYEGLGPDSAQDVEFRFNRFTLVEKGFYPEIGDLIYHNNAYFEIDNVRDVDQLIGGKPSETYSVICSTFMTRRTSIQLEPRNI